MLSVGPVRNLPNENLIEKEKNHGIKYRRLDYDEHRL